MPATTDPRPRLIRTDTQYEEALAYVDTLMSAEPGTPEMDELELWVHLITVYEEERFPIPLPNPIAAIRFRMEQQGLRATDLVPYLGSKSKVSEVLAGKRALSLAMIRRLHEGLGIPAETLIGDCSAQLADPRLNGIDWKTFPLATIAKRGWFDEPVHGVRDLQQRAEELLGGLLLAAESACPGPVTLRQSPAARGIEALPALRAWRARVWQLAHSALAERREEDVPAEIDAGLVSEVARLSVLDDGPLVARRLLLKAGVALVVEPQLPSTRLDGAAMRCADGRAVVGLTLRYDRLDHFWFTLCHELAHLALHLGPHEPAAILDDLELDEGSDIEREANALAAESLIPTANWKRFASAPRISSADLVAFARTVRVHPAVVAGRLRRERNDYAKYGSLLGHRAVRAMLA